MTKITDMFGTTQICNLKDKKGEMNEHMPKILVLAVKELLKLQKYGSK